MFNRQYLETTTFRKILIKTKIRYIKQQNQKIFFSFLDTIAFLVGNPVHPFEKVIFKKQCLIQESYLKRLDST